MSRLRALAILPFLFLLFSSVASAEEEALGGRVLERNGDPAERVMVLVC